MGLITAKNELLAELKAGKGAILVTSSFVESTNLPKEVDEFVASLNMAGYCAGKAAQCRLTQAMTIQLAPDVYVGRVIVGGKVKGTAFDQGDAKIEPDTIADEFWKLNAERTANVATVTDP